MFLGMTPREWALITAIAALLLRWALHVEAHAPDCDHDRARTKERVAALEDAVFRRGQTDDGGLE